MATKPLGLHVHSRRSDDLVREWIETVRPTVMKWLDGGVNTELVELAKARGALTILRVYEPHQSLTSAGQDAYLARVREALQRWPEFDAVEGFNEQFQRLPDIRRRADFDLRLMRLAEEHGKRAVIGSFSVGQPQWPATGHPDDWAGYYPALKHAGQRGHYVGLHEYGAPAMQWGAGANQVGSLVHGRWQAIDPCERQDVDGWFVLRYRKAVEHWVSLGIEPLPRIVITESGLDNIQPRPDVGERRGYKTYRGTEWWDHPVLGDYAHQLAWTCRRWAEDPLVVGGVDFGFADASGDWGDFDMSTDHETFDAVMAEMTTLPDTPVRPVGPPREEIEMDGRTYIAHVMRPGDTLWGLAGRDWHRIHRTVPMGDVREIPVGATVMVPEEVYRGS